MRTIFACSLLLYLLTSAVYFGLGRDVENSDFDGWARCVVARFHPLPKSMGSCVWSAKEGWYINKKDAWGWWHE
jgi:hypothetical protein